LQAAIVLESCLAFLSEAALRVHNILAIVDKPKHKQVAVARALTLGRDFGAHVELAAFTYHPMYDNREVFETHQRQAIKKELLRQQTQRLRDLVLDTHSAFEDVSIRPVWTRDIPGWVKSRVAEKNVDLVVKTGHHSKSVAHTPLDWKLLRETSAPLLLTSSASWSSQITILAALDLNRLDAAHQNLNATVLDAATEMARVHNGKVHCVYAIEISRVLAGLDTIKPRALAKTVRDQAMKEMIRLTKPYGIPKSRLHLPIGSVGTVVNQTASTVEADLLVMGTTARKGVKGLIIGNSAERVLEKCWNDVLAVKP
jgi:universal stress protein E